MLPIKLKPKYKYDLLRIGSHSDGGYLVERNSYQKTKFLIGLGINDDWSFEEKFSKPYIGIDNQISLKFLIKQSISYLPQLFSNDGFMRLIKSFFNILYFFKIKNNFKKAYVSNFSSDNGSLISLSEIIDIYCNKDDYGYIFLKMDIEGSEYRILDDIIKYQDIFSSIIIEFHNIDLNMDRIINFIDVLKMDLVHIHPNNFGGVDKNNNPLVIEITFAKNPSYISEEVILPNPFDSPNNNKSEDIKLKFQKP